METTELIEILARDAAPLRPQAAPWLRAAIWFAVSAAYVAVLIAAMSPNGNRLASIHLSRFWLEQAAALGTGLAAAGAALLSVIPGRSRGWRVIPAIPLAGWLAILVSGCLRDWMARGAAGLLVHADWPCMMAMLMGGVVPIAGMTLMVRRGAPLAPIATALFVGLAGAAMSSVVACMSRPAPHPTTMTVVVWHLGTLLAMVAVVAGMGPRLLGWPMSARLSAALANASTHGSRRHQ
jgi:hypothetical protein